MSTMSDFNVGDRVKGRTLNSKKEIVGVVVGSQIDTPGDTDSDETVEYLVVQFDQEYTPTLHANRNPWPGGEATVDWDYANADDLEKVGEIGSDAVLEEGVTDQVEDQDKDAIAEAVDREVVDPADIHGTEGPLSEAEVTENVREFEDERQQGFEPDATETARELAKEKGVSLYTLTGTGADGRITKKDVELAAEKPSSTEPQLDKKREEEGAENNVGAVSVTKKIEEGDAVEKAKQGPANAAEVAKEDPEAAKQGAEEKVTELEEAGADEPVLEPSADSDDKE